MRRKRNYKRDIIPDTKYNNVKISKFINNLMIAGNKTTIEKFVYAAFDKMVETTNIQDINLLFDKILGNITITYELRSRRVGGANYQVPKPLEEYRSLSKTIKLLVKVVREMRGKSLDQCVFNVLMDAYNKTGSVYSQYNNLVNSAEANKVNSVYRW